MLVIPFKKQYRMHLVVSGDPPGVYWGRLGATNSMQKNIRDAPGGFWGVSWELLCVQDGPSQVPGGPGQAQDGPKQFQGGPRQTVLQVPNTNADVLTGGGEGSTHAVRLRAQRVM